jgi:hypothetical protein
VIRQTLDLLNRHQHARAGANVENAQAQDARAGDNRTAPSQKSVRAAIAPDAGLESVWEKTGGVCVLCERKIDGVRERWNWAVRMISTI